MTMRSYPRHSRAGALGLALSAAILCACARESRAQGGASRTTPAAVQRYLRLVRAEYSGDRALQTVAFMDQYFRVPGNTGFEATLDRIMQLLRASGYVPDSLAGPNARLVYHVEQRPMQRPTWEPVDAELRIEGRTAPLLRYATNRNMLAIYSYSTADTGMVAELVDVGRGTPEDYARVNVTGKIVLGQGNIGRIFADAVSRHGAAGALAYGMPAYTQPEIHPTSIQFGSIPIDTVHRSWGIPLSRAAYDSLRAALAAGPVRLRVRTQARSYPAVERTLVAEVRGSERPDERFVLSAHVQEPGANDNASGVGALSEMARVLAVLQRRGNVVPKRTITMLFGNEISQTENYLSADSVRTRGVRWGMSLDMVGEDTRKTGGTFLIEKMPDPSAVWTRGDDHHTEWGGEPLDPGRIVPHYFNDFVLDRCLDQAAGTGWVVRTNPFEGGSDHVPYLAHGKPGVLLWHFTDHFYHTDGDRLDKVSAQEITNSGICAALSALTLASADGPTTRALVSEVERDGMTRLRTEAVLSRHAIAVGGDPSHEATILRAWTDYYDGALERMDDIEVGGTSAETARAIAAARDALRRTAPGASR